MKNKKPAKVLQVIFQSFKSLFLILSKIALWVYKDANEKRTNAPLWGMLVLLTNLGGLIVYSIYKQSNIVCFKCGTMQDKENIFCTHCGTQLHERCDKCSNIIVKGYNYCSKCGHKI